MILSGQFKMTYILIFGGSHGPRKEERCKADWAKPQEQYAPLADYNTQRLEIFRNDYAEKMIPKEHMEDLQSVTIECEYFSFSGDRWKNPSFQDRHTWWHSVHDPRIWCKAEAPHRSSLRTIALKVRKVIDMHNASWDEKTIRYSKSIFECAKEVAVDQTEMFLIEILAEDSSAEMWLDNMIYDRDFPAEDFLIYPEYDDMPGEEIEELE